MLRILHVTNASPFQFSLYHAYTSRVGGQPRNPITIDRFIFGRSHQSVWFLGRVESLILAVVRELQQDFIVIHFIGVREGVAGPVGKFCSDFHRVLVLVQ